MSPFNSIEVAANAEETILTVRSGAGMSPVVLDGLIEALVYKNGIGVAGHPLPTGELQLHVARKERDRVTEILQARGFSILGNN